MTGEGDRSRDGSAAGGRVLVSAVAALVVSGAGDSASGLRTGVAVLTAVVALGGVALGGVAPLPARRG
ncbi:hypothetical protein GCM10010492_63650 [Saccharothrix mutabilis subsp. mutabilis]|uniref:Uncharacterized protein n=1 Tax=Saccharothrix mutabilis subsp. mutabilis TaxID=66855 RepID=A0ABP3EA04_9PSEU